MRNVWMSSVMGVALVCGTGCSGEVVENIGQAVKNDADNVTLTDTHLEATCKTGQVVKVDKAALEMNVIGMVDFEKQEKAAKSIADQCDAFKKQEVKEDVQLSALKKVAAEKKVDVEGKELEEVRKLVCDALKAELPLKGDRRAELITRNTTSYGCENPGEPELGPERYWQISDEKGTVYLKLDSEEKADSAPDRFTIRCKSGKKLEAYFATTERLKKGAIVVTADKKRGKWKANLAKSKKAAFLKSPSKDLKLLKGKKKLQVRYPAKKKVESTFDVDGIDAALKNLKGRCKV